MINKKSLLYIVQLHQDKGDIISCKIHLAPHLHRLFEQSLRGTIKVVLVEIRNEELHDVFVLEVLPNSVRSHHYELVGAFNVVLNEFRLCVGA